ncbi:MAG: hypothetical protein AAFU85_01430 [Planctomycetota bacterium]
MRFALFVLCSVFALEATASTACLKYFAFVKLVWENDATPQQVTLGDVGTSGDSGFVYVVISTCDFSAHGSANNWVQNWFAATPVGLDLDSFTVRSYIRDQDSDDDGMTGYDIALQDTLAHLNQANQNDATLYWVDFNDVDPWCGCEDDQPPDPVGCTDGSLVYRYDDAGGSGVLVGADPSGRLVYASCSTTLPSQVAVNVVDLFPNVQLPDCCDGGDGPCTYGFLQLSTVPGFGAVEVGTWQGQTVYATCGNGTSSVPHAEVIFTPGASLPLCCSWFGPYADPDACQPGVISLTLGGTGYVVGTHKITGQDVVASCKSVGQSTVHPDDVTFVPNWQDFIDQLNCCDGWGSNPPIDDPDTGGGDPPGDDCDETAYFWIGQPYGTIVGFTPNGHNVYADCFGPNDTPPISAVTTPPADWTISGLVYCDCDPTTPIIGDGNDGGSDDCDSGITIYKVGYPGQGPAFAICTTAGGETVYGRCVPADAVPPGWTSTADPSWDCIFSSPCCDDQSGTTYDCDGNGEDDRYQIPMPECADCDQNGLYDAEEDPVPDCGKEPGNCCCTAEVTVNVNVTLPDDYQGGGGPPGENEPIDWGDFNGESLPQHDIEIDDDWDRIVQRLSGFIPDTSFETVSQSPLSFDFGPAIGTVDVPMVPDTGTPMGAKLDEVRILARAAGTFALAIYFIGLSLNYVRQWL